VKTVLPLLLAVAACGAGQAPLLANAPRPNVAAAAGVTAAAAAALTLASPSMQQKPEDKVNENTQPQQVNESVPSDVLDRLDAQTGSNAPATDDAKTKASAKKKKVPAAHLPSPKEAVERTQPSAVDSPSN
jgi:hypothetical protein